MTQPRWDHALGFDRDGRAQTEEIDPDLAADMEDFDQLSEPVKRLLRESPVNIKAGVVSNLISRLAMLPPERHVGLVQNLIQSELNKQEQP